MRIRELLSIIRKTQVYIPILKPMQPAVLKNAELSHTEHLSKIDLGEAVVRMIVALDSRDKHIEKLLKIVNKLQKIGLNFEELEEYKTSHMNDFYDYAKWKRVDDDDFLKIDPV